MDAKRTELKHRALARKKDLEARLERLRADTAKASHEAMEKVQYTLGEIEDAAKEGWDKLADATVVRLNNLLDKDETDKPAKTTERKTAKAGKH